MRPRLLIISHELAQQHMAGAAIRAWEMAGALAADCAVTLAVPHPSTIHSPAFGTPVYRLDDWDTLRPLVESADAVLCSPHLFTHFSELLTLEQLLIIDGYDPFGLEFLMQHHASEAAQAQRDHEQLLLALRMALACGDFFLCASERQRAYWLGALEVAGRVNVYTAQDDPALRRLVDIVPFGVSAAPRILARRIWRGVLDGIAADDTIALWGGGMWQWLDPLTLIRAVALLDDLPNLRVIFPGASAPRLGEAAPMPIADEARALAESLGVLNKRVFFVDWVPYADWQSALLESDIAISLHCDHVETYLSWRTRALGYLWAGLPMVLSRGDALAEMLQQAGLAILTPPGDAEAVAAAIRSWLRQPDARAALQPAARALADELAWSRCVQPVRDFVLRGARAADKAHTDTAWLHTAREYGAAASAVKQAHEQVSAMQDELAIRLEHLNHAEANRAALQQELDARLQVLLDTNAQLEMRDAQLREVLAREKERQAAEQSPPVRDTWLQRLRRHLRR